MHFLKVIYHTYSFDNQKIIKMNDTMIDVFLTMYSNLYHFTHFRTVLNQLIFQQISIETQINADYQKAAPCLRTFLFFAKICVNLRFNKCSFGSFRCNTERLKPRLGLNYPARIIVAQRKNRAYLLLQFLYSDQVDYSFQH